MNPAFIRFALFFIALLVFDVYGFEALKTAFGRPLWLRILYWSTSAAVLGLMVYNFVRFHPQGGPHGGIQLMIGALILFYVPKMILGSVLLLEDVYRVGKWMVDFGLATFGPSQEQPDPVLLASRRAFISRTAWVLAAVPFVGVLHGIWKGRFNYRVIKETLTFKDLPEAFDGFKIVQVSDIHAGSLDHPEKIAYGVDLANAQDPDILVFTGDLVNNLASEAEDWKETFGRFQAKQGRFSIYGNHDYGDYVPWESPEAKAANLTRLAEIHGEMGFTLLRNEHVVLERNGERLVLAGVENYGKPPFKQYGNLNQALKGVQPSDFTVLLSHDPSHFDLEVKQHPQPIALTLSGHTHGMQFGIEIPGWIKWSPVKFMYPKWAGLYEENRRYLYVNRGFGYIAFPGRVGMWPEVTVLELKRG
jgi:predicted MPP superfamily phosphohydrolase